MKLTKKKSSRKPSIECQCSPGECRIESARRRRIEEAREDLLKSLPDWMVQEIRKYDQR